MLLTACGSLNPLTRTVVVQENVPSSLLDQCLPDPEVPEGIITDAILGDYILDLWKAWFSCHTAVDGVREFGQEKGGN